jgi:hypothetical protein
MATFTVLDETRPITLDATVRADGVRLSPTVLRDALGWELKSEGLCRGPICVPAHGIVDADGVDLQGLADALGRPLAVDIEAGAAALGASAVDRAARLTSLEAPDFTLPDVHGTPHTLSQYRGRKVFLLAYASW